MHLLDCDLVHRANAVSEYPQWKHKHCFECIQHRMTATTVLAGQQVQKHTPSQFPDSANEPLKPLIYSPRLLLICDSLPPYPRVLGLSLLP